MRAAADGEYALFFARDRGFYREDLARLPEAAPGRATVRPEYVGICGSDLHALRSAADGPVCFGHEWVGRVVSAGGHVAPGDLVTTTAFLGCGECEDCARSYSNWCRRATVLGSDRLGALRTWIDVPAHALVVLPPGTGAAGVLYEVAAVADAAVAAAHARDSARDVLVLGAGTVGLLVALACRRRGLAVTIADLEPARVQRARWLDLDAVDAADLPGPRAFDLIFDAAGDSASADGPWRDLLAWGRRGFELVVVGKYAAPVEMERAEWGRRSARITFLRGSPLSALRDAVPLWSAAIARHGSQVISHRFASSQVAEAFDVARDRALSGKVVVDLRGR